MTHIGEDKRTDRANPIRREVIRTVHEQIETGVRTTRLCQNPKPTIIRGRDPVFNHRGHRGPILSVEKDSVTGVPINRVSAEEQASDRGIKSTVADGRDIDAAQHTVRTVTVITGTLRSIVDRGLVEDPNRQTFTPVGIHC